MNSVLEERDRLYHDGFSSRPDKIKQSEETAWTHSVMQPGGSMKAPGDGARSLILKSGLGTGRNV